MRGGVYAPVALLLAALAAALAAAAGPATAIEEPGAALVMPYDSTEGHVSFLAAQNTGSTEVATHWTFWGDDCSRRAAVDICLTPDDSVIVDPGDLRSIGEDNQPLDDLRADLSGTRGFATVTAFRADAECRPRRGGGARIVDDALTGAYSIAELDKNSAFGTSAIVLRTAPEGFVALPDRPLLTLDLYTWNPDTLTKSQLIVIGLRENAGDLPGEVGPLGDADDERVRASVDYVDTLEISTGLPDVEIGCAYFDDAQTLGGDAAASSGFFRLSQFRPAVGGGTPGSRTFLFGLHGWAFFGFAQMQNAVYRFSEQ